MGRIGWFVILFLLPRTFAFTVISSIIYLKTKTTSNSPPGFMLCDESGNYLEISRPKSLKKEQNFVQNVSDRNENSVSSFW